MMSDLLIYWYGCCCCCWGRGIGMGMMGGGECLD